MEVRITSESAERSEALASPMDAARAVFEGGESEFVLLYSGEAGGNAVLGVDPLITLTADAQGKVALAGPGGIVLPTEPLAALESLIAQVAVFAESPLVGWMGFLSYDIGRHIERIPAIAVDDLQWPVLRFALFRHYVVFHQGAAKVNTLSLPGESPRALNLSPVQRAAGSVSAEVVKQLPHAAFEEKIRRVKEYIAAGDIYQANLAQRWDVRSNLTPFEVFERLCEFSAAPYAAFMRFDDGAAGTGTRHVASASPELFLQAENGELITRPIKGTRPRDLADPGLDAALRDELVASAKDRAELTMIVDLLRNDVGRVSGFGTVQVIDPRALEQHPTVWHTVATIASRLRGDARLAEILAALCPGGSITGAPKIRAMQIIEELEPARRGLYCGNMGVIGPGATSLLLNIAIRTILFQGGRAYVHAGGGIVADSEPGREYEETLHKAAAMMRALGVAG
jgi:anthranilate/para-aminobenzoate synthase component I